MTIFVFLLATLRMSLDLEQPARVSRVNVTLVSVKDKTTIVREEPPASIDKLETLELAPGAYDMTITADHHRTVRRRVLVDENTTLGVIGLTRLPLIRGRVTPAGATLRTPDGARHTTDAKGAFAIEVDAQRPAYLIVEAPGRGTRVVDVPPASVDVELPSIELGAPSSVAVSIRRPRGAVEVLLGAADARSGPRVIAQKRLGARETVATFGSLAPGAYTLIVRGEGPLQQLAQKVVLGERDQQRVSVDIQPRTIDARVMIGKEPLANATVRLLHLEHASRTSITTDAHGRWRGDTWQTGAYLARVTAPSMPSTMHAETTLAENWTLALPSISLRGRLVDAVDGKPIDHASLTLRSEWHDGDSTSSVAARSDQDGRFVYRSIPAGRHTLDLRAVGYLYPEPLTFELTGDGVEKELELRLERGVRKYVLVSDTHGAPIAGALVVCADESRIRSMAVTGDDGSTTASLPPNGGVLYVIPRDAPFAVARVSTSALEDPLVEITVSRARGSLEVSTRTESGAPVGEVRLLMRYNGELIPVDVARLIERAQGLAFTTNESGLASLPSMPLGSYEVWPYRAAAEAEQIIASGTMLAAPIRLMLKTGENQVAVKFRAR